MSIVANLQAPLGRMLVLCGILIAPLAGCSEIHKFSTANWIDGEAQQGQHEHPVTEMITLWDNHIRVTEDSENGGAPLPGMVGRLYLLNDSNAVDAHGSVVVQVFDMTGATRQRPPQEVGKWTFPPLALKKLKKKDAIGEGYTLFLPWMGYSSEVREVEVKVCYVAEKGSRRYSSPSKVTFQTDDLPPPRIQERTYLPGQDKMGNPVVPASNVAPADNRPTLVPVGTPILPGGRN